MTDNEDREVDAAMRDAADAFPSFDGLTFGSPEWMAAYQERRDADEARFSGLVEQLVEQRRQDAMPTPSWRDLEDALTALGSEDHIARRLEILRQIRGLSQEQLAAKLSDYGVQMPQSSISKIEVPVKTGKGKRRDITVDEAVALARALEVPLTYLMLPDGALDDLHLHRILSSGAELRDKLDEARLDYEYAVRKLAEAARERPEWRKRIDDELAKVTDVMSGHAMRTRPFLEDVLRQIEEGSTGEQS